MSLRQPRVHIKTILLLLMFGAAWHFALAGKVYAKAWLSQTLLESAWSRSQDGGLFIKPWPWADFWPVAKLTVPRLGIEQLVLAGDSGNVLAFAPGYSLSSAPLSSSGVSLISGHRDTHFAFLKDLVEGDELIIQGIFGQHVYKVTLAKIVNQHDFFVPRGGVYIASQESNDNANRLQSQLLLVTCYPFDSSEQGDLRYAVLATQTF